MDERLLRQLTFEHSSWRWSRSVSAWENERLKAFMIAREHENQIFVDALAVSPDRRRTGIAGRLLDTLGRRPCRLGGGPSHFLPGLPRDWDGAKRFLAKMKFQPDWSVDDLHCRLDKRTGPFTRARESEQKPIVEFVRSEFSTRWTNDTIARFQARDAGDVIVLKDRETPVAFCHTWHFRSKLLGPSVFWLRNGCDTFGGIGPVGVAERMRGKGLGRRIVLEALNYLSSIGVTEVVVDWTSIGEFYEKCGFKPWRNYRGYFRSQGAHR